MVGQQQERLKTEQGGSLKKIDMGVLPCRHEPWCRSPAIHVCILFVYARKKKIYIYIYIYMHIYKSIHSYHSPKKTDYTHQTLIEKNRGVHGSRCQEQLQRWPPICCISGKYSNMWMDARFTLCKKSHVG